jgi:hypothetical protein
LKPIDIRTRINRRALECADSQFFAGPAGPHLQRDNGPSTAARQVATVISLAERRASIGRQTRLQR